MTDAETIAEARSALESSVIEVLPYLSHEAAEAFVVAAVVELALRVNLAPLDILVGIASRQSMPSAAWRREAIVRHYRELRAGITSGPGPQMLALTLADAGGGKPSAETLSIPAIPLAGEGASS